MDSIIQTIDEIATAIKPVSVAIAGLVLVIIGIFWMLAKDPQKKEQQSSWAINVLVGFVIVWSASSLVTWFSKKVKGFQ